MTYLEIKSEPKDFYFVWCRTGAMPTKGHQSYESARNEAVRLARKQPGDKFIIFHGKEKISAKRSTDTDGELLGLLRALLAKLEPAQ